MTDRTDADLLEQFARNESETAFAALVERYIALVHSVALRHTDNPQHAQDITQAVFIILARKARSFGRKTVLSGWLYQTARLTAANFRRSEQRRIRREQEAFMQSSMEETASDEVWPELSPLLDDAMGSLGATDREAIVLRYFQNKTLPEVGVALGMEERAAQKRVSRAVEKLRRLFAKRGVALTATLIVGTVSANSVQAAPVGLAATIAVTAAKGSAVTASTLTLVKGVLKFMAWTKAKTALVTSVIILVAGTTTVIVRETAAQAKLTPQEIAGISQDAYASLSSYSSTGKVLAEVGDQTFAMTFSIKLQRPNLYRIDWTQTSGDYTSKGSVWSAGDGDYVTTSGTPQKKKEMQQALASVTGVSGQAAATIPRFFSNKTGAMYCVLPLQAAMKLKRETTKALEVLTVSLFQACLIRQQCRTKERFPAIWAR